VLRLRDICLEEYGKVLIHVDAASAHDDIESTSGDLVVAPEMQAGRFIWDKVGDKLILFFL
jgi:hypothetical protein